MLAPGGEHDQCLGVRMHGVVQNDLAQFLAQRRAARFAGEHHGSALRPEMLRQPFDMTALAGSIDAFKGDEQALRHHLPPR